MATKHKKKKITEPKSRKEIQDKVVKVHQNQGAPNKEIKAKPVKGTVEVENILPVPMKHLNGVIGVGKKGFVTEYEAELYRRKKHVK